jgi:mannitol-specific phosphotransferase system IIBC component
MFADFESFENRDVFTVLMLLFATILVPLVFLNLLIALISEAFSNVVENITRSDYAELTDIILELEEFMFWNKGNNKTTHLIVAQNAHN